MQTEAAAMQRAGAVAGMSGSGYRRDAPDGKPVAHTVVEWLERVAG